VTRSRLSQTALRAGVAATAVLAVPAVAVGALTEGRSGAFGAALGLSLVAVFFGLSKLVLAAVARRSMQLLLPAALGTYGAKILLLGASIGVIDRQSFFDVRAFAWSVVAGVLLWVVVECVVAVRTRVPFYDPEEFAARRSPRG
jgi:ATP synthase protein I